MMDFSLISKENSSWNKLNTDVILLIGLKLSMNDTINFSLINKHYYKTLSKDYFWKRKYESDFKENTYIPSYKELYKFKLSQNTIIIIILKELFNFQHLNYESQNKLYYRFIEVIRTLINKNKLNPNDFLIKKADQLKIIKQELYQRQVSEQFEQRVLFELEEIYNAQYLINTFQLELDLMNLLKRIPLIGFWANMRYFNEKSYSIFTNLIKEFNQLFKMNIWHYKGIPCEAISIQELL